MSVHDDEPRALVGGTCRCVAHHTPHVNVTEFHHVLPLSWGGTDTTPDTMGPGRNTVEVCPTTHYNTHALLNEYVATKGTPSAHVIGRFSEFTKMLAATAWANRIDGHPTPYW